MNALRGLLYEYGAVFTVGLSQTTRIRAHINSADTELPALVVAECQDLLLQISEQTARIETKTKLLARVSASSETALKQEFITPHCPQQNGMVKRVIRTLKEQCVHRQRFDSIQYAIQPRT